VLATDGDVMLGGLDWTQRIVDHVCEQFKRKFAEDPRENPETLRSFIQECEDAKRQLSQRSQVPISLYYKGKTLTVSMTRRDFERMTADLLQRTKDTSELVLQQAKVDPRELDDVIMAGGSTYMPVVEQMLKEVCKRSPSRDLIPEEAVAQGAAIHAAILEAKETGGRGRLGKAVVDRLRSVNTTDVNSHSLGVKITDPMNPSRKSNHIMIPRNTAIPYEATQRFVTTTPNQQRVHVYVLEGEVADPEACTQIAEFQIVGLPAGLPAGSPVDVTYSYDNSGRIQCTAVDLTGKKAANIEIIRSQGLDAKGVDSFQAIARDYHVE
jgi:molecular chaperone DnaK